MNRADLSLVLNQVDNVGDTLLQNRMLKQRKEERTEDMGVRSKERTEDMGMRERMFTEQQATRKATEQATADWRKETARDRRIQAAIHNNASGTMDDASRTEFNQWIDSDPELRFSGLNLKAPPPKDAKGTMETSQTRNHAELKKLQEQIRSATTPAAKAQAEQDLADFKGLLPGRETPETKPDAGAMTALNELQRSWAEEVKNNNPEEADRIARSIEATRAKWNINPGGPAGAAGSKPAAAPAAGKPLDAATAKQLLQEAGGDKNKARELAKQRGYTF
jgi:hypothetical protein